MVFTKFFISVSDFNMLVCKMKLEDGIFFSPKFYIPYFMTLDFFDPTLSQVARNRLFKEMYELSERIRLLLRDL